jgi:hypothetical protein
VKLFTHLQRAAVAAAMSLCLPALAESLDLSGTWKFVLDPKDLGLSAGPETWNFPDTIQLPGSTAAQAKGDPLKIDLNLEKPAMQHLHQRFPYIGPAWYQREIAIPDAWEGKDFILTLERVLWQSCVWIDQKPVAAPQNSLSVPHRYDLTKFLTPGKIAVGTAVTGSPPLRSVREELPHTAPVSSRARNR